MPRQGIRSALAMQYSEKKNLFFLYTHSLKHNKWFALKLLTDAILPLYSKYRKEESLLA